ncbi:hypothetical protein GQ53DRAFT_803376 [Thozetella sp. PMI_491]|nr:hypothetical protein GQ53DRAFT_803376 [Thozetella sp. PMI_491]
MADSFVPVQPPVPQKVAAPGSTPGSEGADERPAAKRRKIALACNYCRARKTRCDGRQPACSTYMFLLWKRGSRSMKGELLWNLSMIVQEDKLPAASPNHDTIATDAMVIVPSPEGDIDCLVGESSPIAFVRSMLRTIGKNYSPLRAANIKLGDDSPLDRAYLTPKKQDGDVDPVSLPTRRVADALVKAFWEFLHPILPILHKPTFMKSYRVLWMGEDEVGQNGAADNREDPAFLSMLNIVFAIGCQFSDQVSPTRKSAIAKTFYQRSKKAFADDFLDTPTLSVVQLLLLTGVYLQSTVHANRCWNVVGSAIRTAQSLGLHLERTAESKNQLKREMERRVWHTCVFLDRIPLPLIIDDEYLLEDSEGSQPSHLNAQVGSFVYSSKLFDILNEILSSFYVEKSTMFQPSSTPSSSYQELDTVMRLNGALNEFQEKLPSYLVISPDSANPKTPVDDKIALGAKILYSRFLYIRIFLLRPILLLVAQSSTNISPEKKLHTPIGPPFRTKFTMRSLAL